MAWAMAPPHGYPARQERVDYVNDNPRRSRRTKDTQHGLRQQGERGMSGRLRWPEGTTPQTREPGPAMAPKPRLHGLALQAAPFAF